MIERLFVTIEAMSLNGSFARLCVRGLALVCVGLGVAGMGAANGQAVSVYATASPAYLNHLYTISSGTSPQYYLSGQWLVGANAGVTFTVSQTDKMSVGFDFRGGPEIGTPGIGTALAGVKLGFKPGIFHLKPYGQLSVGFLEQKHQTGSGAYTTIDAQSYFGVELFGGVDYPLARHVDIRVVEVGIGANHVVVNNGNNTKPSPEIFSLNSGLVFHF
jgi:hypothetical protein